MRPRFLFLSSIHRVARGTFPSSSLADLRYATVTLEPSPLATLRIKRTGVSIQNKDWKSKSKTRKAKTSTRSQI